MIPSNPNNSKSYLENQRDKLLNPAEKDWPEKESRRISIPCQIYISATDQFDLRETYDFIFGAEEAHAVDTVVSRAEAMLYPDFTGTAVVEDSWPETDDKL